jgi:type I restriction enzyme, S subunit
MPNDTNRTSTPKLRFPEFQEPWREKRLEELGSLILGLTYSPEDVRDDGLLVLRSSNIQDGHLALDDNVFVRRDIAGANPSEPNDILICVRNGSKSLIGKNALIPEGMPPCTHGAFMTVFRSPSAHFTFQLFQTATYQEQVAADLGATINSINGSQLKRYRFFVPDPAEQQKIGDCLNTLDRLIAAQVEKVETLKAHKKGLMQQLFARERETLPRLRFVEFLDAPEWAEKNAGELFANRKEDGEEGLPIYSVTINDGMVPRASFDRDFYDIEDPAGNKKACKGDIAYNMMRMWQGAQGVAVEDCMVSPAYVVLAPLDGVSSDFFAYLFKLPQSLQLLTAYSRGLTKDRLRLYFDDFARMPLRMPTFGEQERIADCLSSLDALLAAETKKFIALKTHKKGLMQQLFPSPEGD